TPQFHTEQENDPLSSSDCTSVATNASRVTVTELEVFAAVKGAAAVPPVVVPPVVKTPTTVSGGLPATGLGAGVGLGGIVLLGMGGVVWALRRRLA
ncbi:MAG: hypothetical protein JWO12_565, partial [Frankiales bacterium]|nr:hypothetical protein [Frankiales bacterium]